MKILFVINDGDARYMEYEHTGVLNAPTRRAVEIELTPEQVEKICVLCGFLAVCEIEICNQHQHL